MKGFIFKTVAGNGITLLLGEINTPIIKEEWYQDFKERPSLKKGIKYSQFWKEVEEWCKSREDLFNSTQTETRYIYLIDIYPEQLPEWTEKDLITKEFLKNQLRGITYPGVQKIKIQSTNYESIIQHQKEVFNIEDTECWDAVLELSESEKLGISLNELIISKINLSGQEEHHIFPEHWEKIFECFLILQNFKIQI